MSRRPSRRRPVFLPRVQALESRRLLASGVLLDAGFESPAVGAGSFSDYVAAPAGTPWVYAGGAGVAGNGSGYTAGNPGAPDGTQVGFLEYTGSAAQTVDGWQAGSYVVSFQAAQRGNYQASRQDLAVTVDGQTVGTFTPGSTSYAGYATAAFTVTAGSHTVAVVGLDTAGGDNTALLDSVAVAQAPAAGTPAVGDAGFEAPSVGTGSFSDYVAAPAGTPWAYAGGAGVAGNGSGYTVGNPGAPDGTQVGFLEYTGSMGQSVANWAAGSYVISFQAAQRGNYQASQQDFAVTVDGRTVGTFTPAGTAYGSYATAPFTVAAGAHTIAFQGLDTAGGDNTAFLDSVAVAQATAPAPPPPPSGVTATAGPSTVALAWTAAAGATGYRVERQSAFAAWTAVGTAGAGVTTFTDAGLAEATSYTYRVIATNAAGDSAPSSTLFVTTALYAPTGLTAAVVSGGRIDLSWTDHSSLVGLNSVSYVVEQSPDGSTAWHQVGTASALSPTSYTATGPFNGSTTYYFRVHAHTNGAGDSDFASASATTPAFPNQPALKSATAQSDTAVALSWSDAPGEAGFRIERMAGVFSPWAVAGTVAAGVTNFTDTGLSEATPYLYRVVATNAVGESAPSVTLYGTTSPSAPTGLTATVVSGGQVNLSWTDHSAAATSYVVEQSPDGSTGWQQVGTVSGSGSGVTATGPFNGSTTYYFRVHAHANGAGDSGFASATATTPGFPNVPGQFTALGVSPIQVTMTWQDDVNETSYRIDRSSDGTNWVQVATPTAGATAFTDSGLTKGTIYQYRIKATNAAGDSGYSIPVTAQTPNYYHPTVATPAAAVPPTGSGKTAGLSVLGDVVGGESILTYRWSVVSAPVGAPAVVFSTNGTNAAKGDVATFGSAGNYTLRATITNGTASTTSDVSVTVIPAVSSITISPSARTIKPGATQQFVASGTDQFGHVTTISDPVDWSLPPGTPGAIDADGLYTAPADIYDDVSVAVDAEVDGVSADSQATVSQREVVNFDDLPAGTVVTNQYSNMEISGDPAYPNVIVASSDASPPNSIGAPTPPPDGDSIGNPYIHPLYIDFTTPVNGLHFVQERDDSAAGVEIAEVNVFEEGKMTVSVPVFSTGGFYVPGEVDLSEYSNITRIEVTNVTDPAGLLYDDFSFISAPKVVINDSGYDPASLTSKLTIDDDFSYNIPDDFDANYFYSDLNADPATNGYSVDPTDSLVKKVTVTVSGGGAGTLSWQIPNNINVWWQGVDDAGPWELVTPGEQDAKFPADGKAHTVIIQGVRPGYGLVAGGTAPFQVTYTPDDAGAGGPAKAKELLFVYDPIQIKGGVAPRSALISQITQATGYDLASDDNGYIWITGGTNNLSTQQQTFRQYFKPIWSTRLSPMGTATPVTVVTAVDLLTGPGDPFDRSGIGTGMISTGQIQSILDVDKITGSAILLHTLVEQYYIDVYGYKYDPAHAKALEAEVAVMGAESRTLVRDFATPENYMVSFVYFTGDTLVLKFTFDRMTGTVFNVNESTE